MKLQDLTQNELDQMTDNIGWLRSRMVKLETERDEFLTERNNLLEERAQLTRKLEHEELEVKRLTIERSDLSDERIRVNTEVNRLATQRNELSDAYTILKRELDSSRQLLEDKTNECIRLGKKTDPQFRPIFATDETGDIVWTGNDVQEPVACMPETIRNLIKERNKFRLDSIAINRVGYKLAVAMGYIKDGEGTVNLGEGVEVLDLVSAVIVQLELGKR